MKKKKRNKWEKSEKNCPSAAFPDRSTTHQEGNEPSPQVCRAFILNNLSSFLGIP